MTKEEVIKAIEESEEECVYIYGIDDEGEECDGWLELNSLGRELAVTDSGHYVRYELMSFDRVYSEHVVKMTEQDYREELQRAYREEE